MTANAHITRPWHHASGVTACPDCGGFGVVAAPRRPTTDDPYPEEPCDCGRGEHLPECPVCGFAQEVAGYDCLACDTVASLADADIIACDGMALLEAIGHALLAAQADLLARRSTGA